MQTKKGADSVGDEEKVHSYGVVDVQKRGMRKGRVQKEGGPWEIGKILATA